MTSVMYRYVKLKIVSLFDLSWKRDCSWMNSFEQTIIKPINRLNRRMTQNNLEWKSHQVSFYSMSLWHWHWHLYSLSVSICWPISLKLKSSANKRVSSSLNSHQLSHTWRSKWRLPFENNFIFNSQKIKAKRLTLETVSFILTKALNWVKSSSWLKSSLYYLIN